MPEMKNKKIKTSSKKKSKKIIIKNSMFKKKQNISKYYTRHYIIYSKI